jgi:hypothetical protein
VIRLLGKSAALEKQKQTFVPGRLAVLEHVVDAWTDVGPDLLPYLVRAGAEHPVAFDADRRQVGVVTKERELRPPQHPHCVTGIEHHPHDGFQRLRPVRCRTERRARPVEGAHARAHFAAAPEKSRDVRRIRHGDVGDCRSGAHGQKSNRSPWADHSLTSAPRTCNSYKLGATLRRRRLRYAPPARASASTSARANDRSTPFLLRRLPATETGRGIRTHRIRGAFRGNRRRPTWPP